MEGNAQEKVEALIRTIQSYGPRDARVLAALRETPRHVFVPEDLKWQAYANRPLPFLSGQTVSQPYIVALMTDLLQVKPKERYLEVGTGSGYQAAVLRALGADVFSVEYLPEVAEYAIERLTQAGVQGVQLKVGDGFLGWPEAAPFQGILVTAAAARPPGPLLSQLAVGGRLVIPIGDQNGQALWVWERTGPGESSASFSVERVCEVRFVPFLGNSEAALLL